MIKLFIEATVIGRFSHRGSNRGETHLGTWGAVNKKFTFFVDCGRFVYFEAADRSRNDIGTIATQQIHTKQRGNCLQFYLFMHSNNRNEMGNFTVYIYDNALKEVYHDTKATTGRIGEWEEVNVNINLDKVEPFWVS